MSAVLPVALALLLPALGGDASFRIDSGAEWDTNAERLVNTGKVPADGLIRLLADAELALDLTRTDHVDLEYVLGAKRFASLGTEDLAVNDLSLRTSHRLAGAWLDAGTETILRASDMRSGRRSYDLGYTGGMIGVWPIEGLHVRAGAQWYAFGYAPDPRLDFDGPAARGDVSFQSGRLLLTGWVEHDWRAYRGPALIAVSGDDGNVAYTDCSDGTCTPRARRDTELQAGGDATWQGASYYLEGLALARFDRSTSALESTDRYRLSVLSAFDLPLGFVLHATGALQLNFGISLTQALNLADDDENQNSVTVQLEHALVDQLALKARYALFANQFATANAGFLRQTLYVGVSWGVDAGSGRD